jgi:hypothetical protein
MSVQKVGMVVCCKPSFRIKISASAFNSFLETWKVSGGLRIGPFEIHGGGGSRSSDWKADASSSSFSGATTSEAALIMDVNIQVVNPLQS